MAVFTPVDRAEAKAFFAAYDLGRLIEFSPIAEGVSNTNFAVVLEAGAYALTLFEAATPDADLPYFLDLTDHLAAKGYPAPAPIAARDGVALRSLNGRRAVVIDWLPGAWPRHPSEAEAFAAGASLANLHREGADFTQRRGNPMGPSGWDDLLAACAQSPLSRSGRAADLLKDLRAEVAHLQAHWPAHLPSGLGHADFFPDNVLMVDGKVSGVIDYYYACDLPYAYDLAIALTAWGFTADGSPLPKLFRAFCAGYQSQRPLSAAEIEALPLLGRASAVRFTLTRLRDLLHHDPKALVRPKDPEAFFRRLAYHRSVTSGEVYAG